MDKLGESTVAWIAGLFEGEGSCLISWKQSTTGATYPAYRMSINMTDGDVLGKLHSLIPGSTLTGPFTQKSEKHKDFWRWNLHKRKLIKQCILLIKPWMGDRRRAKMDEILELMRIYPEHRWQHGTRYGYEVGCRCQECKDAHASRQRIMRKKRKKK